MNRPPLVQTAWFFLTLVFLAAGCAKTISTDTGSGSRNLVGPNWGDPNLRPPTPTGFRGDSISGTQVQLDWDALPAGSNPAAAFRLYRKPTPGMNQVYQALNPSVLTFTDSGLTPDHEYTYYLTAMNIYGESPATMIKVTPTNKPAMPTNLTAVAVSAQEVRIEFVDNSNDEVSFLLERRTSSGQIGVVAINVPAYGPTTGVRTYLDSGVQPEISYRYRVKSVGPGDASHGFTELTPPVTPSNIPSTPANISAVAQSGTQVLVQWANTAYNATSFTVRRQLSSGSQTTYFEATQLSFLDNSASPETNYRYSVRANNGTFGSSAYSAFAYVTTPSMDPPIPTNLAFEILAPNQVRLTWSPNGALPSARFEVKHRLQGQNYGSANLAEGLIEPLFVHSSAAPGSTQFYKVRAVAPNGLGASPYTAEISVTTPSGLPANPSNLHLVAVTEHSASIAWTGSGPLYKLQRRFPPGAWADHVNNLSSPNFEDTGLAADKSIEYRVRAYNQYGESPGFSNVLAVRTLTLTPLAPTGLSAVSPVPGDEVELAFQNNDPRANLLGFQIFRRINGGAWPGNPTYVISGAHPIGPVNYVDTAVEHNKTYHYRVLAVNAYGDSAYSNVASVLVDQQPDAPLLTGRYRTIGGYSNVLRWNAIAFATGYEIQRRVGSGSFQVLNINPALSGEAVEYIDVNVSEGTQYTYRMRSKFGSVLSVYSNSVSVKPGKVPSVPSQFQATQVLANQASLSWLNESDNQLGFQIFRRVNGSLDLLAAINSSVAPDTTVNYTLTGLLPNRTYDLVVKAVNIWGDSEPSSTLRITTPAQ